MAAVLDAAPGARERLRDIALERAGELDSWLQTYGVRTANDDPGSPTLLEIPDLLDSLLRQQVASAAAQPPHRAAGAAGVHDEPQHRSAQDPGATHDGGAPADRAVARARAGLSAQPIAHRRRFERELAAARKAYPIREDNVLWALSAPSGLARRAVMEIGRRLTARAEIDDPGDVVMLDLGTGSATRTLVDRQRVLVDGTAGQVLAEGP